MGININAYVSRVTHMYTNTWERMYVSVHRMCINTV